MACLNDVAELDDALLTITGREAVVVLVHRKDHADAAVVIVLETRDHILLRAAAKTDRRGEEAIEEVRDLDSQNHRQVARENRFARLGSRGDDAEPALPGSTLLGIDVILHPIGLGDLAVDAHHVVARVARGLNSGADEEIAENLVSGSVLDDKPHPAQIGALEPLVVLRLMGRAIRSRPVWKLRVAGRFVVVLRQLTGEQRGKECCHVDVGSRSVEGEAGEIGTPLRAVIGAAIGQGVLDAEAVERGPMNHTAAAEGPVLEDVGVDLGESEEISVVEADLLDSTPRICSELGMLATSARLFHYQIDSALPFAERDARAQIAARLAVLQAKGARILR